MHQDDIKDYPSLIRFIISERPGVNLNQKYIAKEMGISWASFVDIKHGKVIPKENLANKIAGYMRNKFNITYKDTGNKIIIDKITNSNNEKDLYRNNGDSDSSEILVLVRKIVNLEVENANLKKEIEKLKNLLRVK